MGIARRSTAELIGELCSVDSPSPLHLPSSFHVHEHRTASRLLSGISIHHAMAGNASLATTCIAALPCMAVAGLLSSIDTARTPWGSRGDGGRLGGLA
jgi:hypothetical protein